MIMELLKLLLLPNYAGEFFHRIVSFMTRTKNRHVHILLIFSSTNPSSSYYRKQQQQQQQHVYAFSWTKVLVFGWVAFGL